MYYYELIYQQINHAQKNLKESSVNESLDLGMVSAFSHSLWKHGTQVAPVQIVVAICECPSRHQLRP